MATPESTILERLIPLEAEVAVLRRLPKTAPIDEAQVERIEKEVAALKELIDELAEAEGA